MKNMSDKSKSEGGICVMPEVLKFFRLIRPVFFITVIIVFIGGCTKDENPDLSNDDILLVAGITEVFPANLADSIEINPVVSVTFKAGTDASVVSETTLTLKKGQTTVPGKTTLSGTTAIFTPDTDLIPETEYIAIVMTGKKSGSEESEGHEYSWRFKTGSHHHNSSLKVVSTDPGNKATAVSVAVQLIVTFNSAVTSEMRNASLIVVKNGQNTVSGSLTYSGSTATFRPATNLAPNTIYSVKVMQGTGSNKADSYNWSFTTGGDATDTTAPTVTSVTPSNNATSIVTGSTYKVVFSETMNSGTITAANITLKQGTVAVAGTVTYSGVTATFTPAAALNANTVYTGTVSSAVKDAAGNSLATAYTSTFTTVATITDITAPTVLSVTPLNNATSVTTASGLSATFSEPMNASTLSTTTFTLKQGSTTVAGTVSYSGTTAAFTPSAPLKASTVYTGTITTGTKDVAGNSLGTKYTWNFTTVATVTAVSFASDVVPVLAKCNDCHTHKWTTSSNTTTFYTNLVNAGYVNTSSPSTSKIYTKISGGHGGSGISSTEINKILNWFTEGAGNN